jgi:putative heme-binding domain-containing protein
MISLVLSLLLLQGAAPSQDKKPQAPAPAQEKPVDPNLPPDPEIERRSFKVAEGFEVTLFAADPLVAKPTQMNFDARGRLWISTSSVYPQVVPGEIPNDKIVILEDTDGDGKADKSTVFAEGLFIPTGIEPGHGGCYVANSTELIHLKDVDGDGKADERRVLLSGFGTEDTHHIIHTFRWGPDGALYFNQSIYIHSNIETPRGTRRLGGAGIWRFRPESLDLDVFVKGMCNPWGHEFDRWGNSFGTDGAGGDGIHYLVPGFTYPHFPSGEKHFPGLNPGQPKYCANETISGRHFPDDWQGDIVTNDFRANRVVRFKISDDGSGFSSKLMPDLITSTDRAFRPIDVRMGPDGALYIADWYNPIINHGEVGFRDPRRDKTHGRIWRVTAKDRPLVARPKLVGVPVRDVVEQLKSPEGWTRHFAKRALAERDPREVREALADFLKANPDEHDRLEALWMYQTLDLVQVPLLKELLRAKDFNARAAATRILARWGSRMTDALELLEAQVADEHPRVRIEAVRALKEFSDPRAIEIATKALDKPMDRFLEHALWLTANDLRPIWLPEFQAEKLTFGGNKAHEEFALRSVKSPLALKALADQVKAGWQSMESRLNALNLLAGTAGADELTTLFTATFPPEMQSKVLAAIARGARERNVRPAGDLTKVKRWFDSPHEATAVEALLLAGLWKLEPLRPDLVKAAEAGRRAAIDGLASLGGDASVEFFKGLTAPEKPLRLRQLGVIGLTAIDIPAATPLASAVLEGDCTDVFTAFLLRKGGSEALLTALKEKKPSADAARLGLRAMYAAGLQEPALRELLNGIVGLTPRGKNVTPAQLTQWAALVREKGDPARGEAIFRRKELSCFQCHAIGGAGSQVGPDFMSLGASAPVDYLVESVLVPDAKQKEGFVSMQVLTKSGDILSGVRVRQNDKELVLRDAARDEMIIPLDAIEKKKEIGSIMPAGLADLLTDAEFLDLVRFLSELGKPGPFAVTAAPLIRRWRVPDAAGIEVPAYSLVAGALPADAASAKGEINVVTPGLIRIKLNSAKGLTLSVDGAPVETKEVMDLELKLGIHQLKFDLDASRRGGDPLRVEVEEAPGSAGRVQVVGGK